MKPRSIFRLGSATLLAVAACSAFAADTSPVASATSNADRLAPARAQIAAQKWAAAIDELKRVNDYTSADWNNLMGYSLRKAKTPDYPGAERHYNEALRIDPAHRGALEYSGELYLMTGDLPRAEQRLAILGQACAAACSEYADLKTAVERFKANGKHSALGS